MWVGLSGRLDCSSGTRIALLLDESTCAGSASWRQLFRYRALFGVDAGDACSAFSRDPREREGAARSAACRGVEGGARSGDAPIQNVMNDLQVSPNAAA